MNAPIIGIPKFKGRPCIPSKLQIFRSQPDNRNIQCLLHSKLYFVYYSSFESNYNYNLSEAKKKKAQL